MDPEEVLGYRRASEDFPTLGVSLGGERRAGLVLTAELSLVCVINAPVKHIVIKLLFTSV